MESTENETSKGNDDDDFSTAKLNSKLDSEKKSVTAPTMTTALTTTTSSITTTTTKRREKVPGDLVWARMKGFSWWPSRITAPNPEIKPPAAARHKPHHFCYFFGSDNYAWVEEEKMADYDGNREKFKPAKISANLQAAIDRIEEALIEWKLKRGSDICASVTFEGASSPSSPKTALPRPVFDFDDDDSDADIFSSNIMTNRNGNNSGDSSPRVPWRSEDSSDGAEFSLNISAFKRKATSETATDADRAETTAGSEAPVKTKRARKAPSKLADFDLGAELRDAAKPANNNNNNNNNAAKLPNNAAAKPPVRTFARKTAATAAAAAPSSVSSSNAASAADPIISDVGSSLSSTTTSPDLKLSKRDGDDDLSFGAAAVNPIKKLNGDKTSKPSNRLESSSPSSSCTAPSPSKLRLSPSSLRFGFLGLGAMGSALAASLLKSGHRLSVWNRTKDKCRPLVKAGAVKGASAAEVVASSDVTFSCVSDPAALREVVFGNSGALQGVSAGKGFVDLSTVDVETCLEVAEAVCSRGGRFLEAPLCGSKESARRGGVVVVAAGDKKLYDDCQTCFNAFSKTAFYLGDVGNASKMKSVMNLLDGVVMAGLAEAMALSEQVGLRHQDVMEVMELGSLDCELLREKGREMTEGTFTPSVALKHQQKDLKLAVNLADEHHLPLVTAAAANELFKRARAMGYDEHDNSAVYRAAQYNS